MKAFREKALKNKKVALLVAAVFIFVTVVSLTGVNIAYAENEAISAAVDVLADPSPEVSPEPEVFPDPEVSFSPEVFPEPEASLSPEVTPEPQAPLTPEALPGLKQESLVSSPIVGVPPVPVYYTINASCSAGGSISPSGNVQVLKGNNQSFTFTPISGYYVKNVLIDGDVKSSATSPYPFNNVNKDHTIYVEFALITYTITTSSSGAGSGTITSTETAIPAGANRPVTITADSGSYIASYTVDGSTTSAPIASPVSLAFNAISADHTVSAVFQKSKKTILHIHTTGASAVTISYNGSPLTCSNTGGVWSAEINEDYAAGSLTGVTIDGTWYPASKLDINAGGATVNMWVNASYSVLHEYYAYVGSSAALTYVGSYTSNLTAHAGTVIDPAAVTQVPLYNGYTYTYLDISPDTAQTVTEAGGTLFTVRYVRNASIATYRVEHYYYYTTNGGPKLLYGYTSPILVNSFVGAAVYNNDVPRLYDIFGKTWAFESIYNPYGTDPLIITGNMYQSYVINYIRNTATYNVVHEYYTVTDGVSAASPDSTVPETVSDDVGKTINPADITKETGDYHWVSASPSGSFVLSASGARPTVTLRYERNLKTYTYKHEYYTITNGGSPVLDGSSAPVSQTGVLGSVINAAGLPRVTTFGGNTYGDPSVSPLDTTLTEDGLSIVLRYERNLKTYTYKHEYYTSTNGGSFTLDGSSAPVNQTGVIGSVIDVSAIPQVTSFNSNTYGYVSAAPLDTTLTEDGLSIVLRYERSITVYSITTSASAGGSITGLDDTIPPGSERTITYTPDQGFHLLSLSVDGSPVDITAYPTSYTFTDIQGNHTVDAVFAADPTTGTISIVKVDGATNLRLANAAFGVYSDAGLSTLKYSLTTNGNGEASVSDVPAGNYWVKETAAPAGYTALASSIPITVTAGETTSIVVPNTGTLGYGTGNIKIVKTDASTGKALSGAKFTIYSDSALTKAVTGLVTDNSGIATAEALDPGTYYIAETQAPAGYSKLSGSITAVVVENTTTTINIKNSKTEEKDYQTGMNDYNMLIIGSIILLAGAALLFLYTRKKNENATKRIK